MRESGGRGAVVRVGAWGRAAPQRPARRWSAHRVCGLHPRSRRPYPGGVVWPGSRADHPASLLTPRRRTPHAACCASCVRRQNMYPCTWLQVFKRAHTALLGSGRGPAQRTSLVPSEKCAVSWGSDDDEMRMITASFVRAIERFAGDLCRHFLPLFQKVVAIKKTCNQLISISCWDMEKWM